MILKISDGAKPGVEEGFLGDFADAVECADGQGTKEVDLAGFGDAGESGGFAEVAGEFGEELVGGDADAGGEAAFGTDALLEGLGEGLGAQQGVVVGAGTVAAVGGDIEVGFVHGDLLDLGAGLGEERHDQVGFGAVMIHPWREEHGGGAQACCGAGRHGGPDAEPAGLIAGGADDAPAVSGRAHDNGLAAKRRVIALLDRREEGVHIEMEDDAVHAARRVCKRLRGFK